MRTLIYSLILSIGLLTPLGRAHAQAPGDARQVQATRAELQGLLADYESAANSTAYSNELRERARTNAQLVRTRLEEGDFQVGDQIALVVEGEEALTHTFIVQPGPTLVLPSIGSLSLKGVLRSELEDNLRAQIGKYVRNPVVHASSSIRIVVSGAVGKAGYYVVGTQSVFTDVLMAAGGPAANADLKHVKVERDGSATWEGDALQKAIIEGRTLDQLGFRAGDEILVPQVGKGFNIVAARTVLLGFTSLATAITLLTRIF
jgi:protein involved in polysaccharide export with SLBB domain